MPLRLVMRGDTGVSPSLLQGRIPVGEMPGQSGVPIRKGFTMSDDSGKSKKLSLSGSKLTLGGVDAGQMRAGATGRAPYRPG